MKQVVLVRPGEFQLQEIPLPAAPAQQALVRVRRIGVCGTDLHAFEGRQPFFSFPRILGHELAVEIVECPNNPGALSPGDRCAVEPYLTCGHCHACKLGRTNCCEHLEVFGVHRDGGMREFMYVPVDRLYKSNELTFDQLALVEPLGIGAHAVIRSGLAPGETALVVGGGPIGLAVAQFARATGAQVHMLEINPSRRALISRLDFPVRANPDAPLADVVFDATGNPQSMARSVGWVAHAGRLVFVGLVEGTVAIEDPLFHRREITLFASRNSAGEFPRIIALIERGQIDTSSWITHRMTLEEVPELFPQVFRDPTCFKAMVEVNGPPVLDAHRDGPRSTRDTSREPGFQ